MSTETQEDRRRLFDCLQSASTQNQFFARVADDVDWTVQGAHPRAGRYRSMREFTEHTFARLAGVFREGAELVVEHLYVDGDMTIAELRATSTSEGFDKLDHRELGLDKLDQRSSTGGGARPRRGSSRGLRRPVGRRGRRTRPRAGSGDRCASARGCAPTSRRCGRR